MLECGIGVGVGNWIFPSDANQKLELQRFLPIVFGNAGFLGGVSFGVGCNGPHWRFFYCLSSASLFCFLVILLLV